MDSPLITAHDLRLLSAGYYIQAGIAAFYTLMLLGYLSFVGVVLGNLARLSSEGKQPIPQLPPAVLSIVTAVLAVLVGIACAYTACLFIAAYWLRRLRNMLFIQIMAALNCFAIPYGTVLGIFTFMVLQRPSAKQLFENQRNASACSPRLRSRPALSRRPF